MKSGGCERLLLAGLAGLLTSTALADDASSIRIRAYGQIGYGLFLSGNGADVTSTAVNPATGTPVATTVHHPTTKYEGYERSGNWDRDTRIGINISGDLSPTISFSLGLLTERYSIEQADDRGANWPVRTTLALMRFEPGANVSIMIGRLAAPFWLISEEKYVGLTYPWIRPPLEVYDLVAGTENLDGARATYTANFGELTVKPSAFAGNFMVGNNAIGAESTGAAQPQGYYRGAGGAIDLEYLWLTAHVVYSRAKGVLNAIDRSPQTVQTTSGQPVTVYSPSAYSYSSNATFTNFGLRATPGNLLFMAEYARVYFPKFNTAGPLAPFQNSDLDRSGYYATLGYTIGAFQPRVTYGHYQAKIGKLDSTPLGQSLGALPSALSDKVEKSIVNAAGLSQESQSLNLGVNYQINPGTIFKIEYQQTRAPSGDYGGFFSLAPKATARIAQAAVDFAM